MDENSIQKDISSAEMTAIYRTLIPQISKDRFSQFLVSESGRKKSQFFIEKYNYPLVGRKVSARAGYILEEVLRLLRSGYYDSVISLASGFSLLLYCIAENYFSQISQKNIKNIHYIDTDLAYMIIERNNRMNNIQDKLNPGIYQKLQTGELDLEKTSQEKIKLKEIFPQCKNPIFIIEGVIYFLSINCVNWIIDEIASYDQAAIVMDYWPNNMLDRSDKFKEAFKDINQFIPEQTKSFWDEKMTKKLNALFSAVEDHEIADIDDKLSSQNGLFPELLDPNHYFPLKMMTVQKGKIVG